MGLSVYRFRCTLVAVALFLLAAALFVAGYFLPVEINRVLKSGLRKQVIVDSESSTGYANWQDTGLPDEPITYMKFHVFNITNPDEYLAGARPNVVDLGPYSYKERRIKLNVSFTDDGDVVQYWLWQYFTVDPSTTGVHPDTGLPLDPCNDVVFSAYTAYQAVQANLGTSWWQSLLFSTVVSHVQVTPINSVSVQELIWGTDCSGKVVADPLLKFVSTLQPGTPTSVPLQVNLTSEEETLNITGFNMQYTGKNNISQIHNYIMWNSASSVSVWATPEANRVVGSDGYNFEPGLKAEDNLTIWVDVLQRSTHVLVNRTTNTNGATTKEIAGIKCLWYTPNQEDFAPDPAYWTFCPIGVLNFTTASNGAPVFISKPHFLDANDYYLEMVTGLSPNRTLHDTNIFVEPISGIMMESQKRLQINLNVNSSLLYPSLSAAFVPVIWIEESGSISPSLASQFRSKVYGALTIRKVLLYIGFIGGGVIALCCLAIVLSILAPDRNPLPPSGSKTAVTESEPLLRDNAGSPAFLDN